MLATWEQRRVRLAWIAGNIVISPAFSTFQRFFSRDTAVANAGYREHVPPGGSAITVVWQPPKKRKSSIS